jgi:hypothetical protein
LTGPNNMYVGHLSPLHWIRQQQKSKESLEQKTNIDDTFQLTCGLNCDPWGWVTSSFCDLIGSDFECKGRRKQDCGLALVDLDILGCPHV